MNTPTEFQREVDTMIKERKVAQRPSGRAGNDERSHEYRIALLDHEYRLAVLDHEFRMRKLELGTVEVVEPVEDDFTVEDYEEIDRDREIETIDDIDPEDLEEQPVLRPAKPLRKKLESCGAAPARNDWSKDRSHLVQRKKLVPRAQQKLCVWN
jgi:hypothetical protein